MRRIRRSEKKKNRSWADFFGIVGRRPSPRRILCGETLEGRQLLAGDLNVLAFSPTPSGFLVEFNQPVDTSVLNLYDAANGALGMADLSLVGATTGPVSGSALVEGNHLRFVATGGALAHDTYTVRLRSAEDGLKALDGGSLLDGEFTGAFPSGDSLPGGDFVFSFVAAPENIVVSIPDFARGPAQPAHVPAAVDGQPSDHGLPVHVNDANGVTSLLLQVAYNPAMLQITDVALGKDAPTGSQVTVNLSEPGLATLAFFTLEPMPSGPANLVSFTAHVPRDAPYGEAHAIEITSLEVNAGALAATGDEGVHVVAFPGDANRNMRYDAEDARLIARVGVGLDSGLAVDPPHADPAVPLRHLYPMIDALIIGDVTGDGTLSALDASDILRKAVDLPTPEIPELPENSAPISVSLSPDTLPENEPVGTVVGLLTTVDPDEGDAHTYELVSGEGSDDHAYFFIDGDTLKTAAVLDFESQSVYQLRIRSTDLLGLSVEQTLLVYVTDVNEAPMAVLLMPNSVSPNTMIGDEIGQLTTIDPDIGDTHAYLLVAGEGADDNFRFEIVGNQLRLADFLDLPFQTTYQLRVRSTDTGGLSVEEMLTVVANLAPTDVTLTPDTVQANAPLGTVVGIFTTVDPDPGDTHTYSLVEGVGDEDNAAFIIDGDQLRTAAELVKNAYSIRVRSTDAGGLIVEQTLLVTVIGLNQAPTAVLLTPNSVSSNTMIGDLIGQLETVDPDVDDSHTYLLVAGEGADDNFRFEIVGDQLRLADFLDLPFQTSYQLRVRSTDAGGLSVEQTLLITVIDVNEEPTAVLLTPSSVSQETEIGDVIGLLTTFDPDIGDTHTYELVEGEGANDNFRFEIVGDELKLAGDLDLTTQTIYQIRVRSTDAGDLSVEEMLWVIANTAPTAVLLSPDSIEENVPVGSVVGVFTSEDPDEGDAHTYSLVEGDGDEDNAAFSIVGDQLTTAVELDYETKDTYLIRVRSTDSGGLSVDQTLLITVIDVNEEPTAVLLTPNSVSQETEIGDVIGLLTTVDPDIGDSHTYELVEGEGANDNFRFEIVGDELKLAGDLDLTTQTIYQIRVRSTDTGGLTIEQTLEVIANQPPTEVLLSLHASVEEAPPGTAIGVLTTIDPNVGDWHTYQLVAGEGDGDNAAFFLDGNELKTAVQLDLESRESYQIRVLSTDNGGLSVEAMLQIHVNQAPVHLLPSPQTTGINQELTFSAAMANAIVITDADAGSDSLSVQLTPVGGTLNVADELFGSLDELNQLLDGLIFTPDSDFQGEALLDILTNDLGHNGLGGARTANDQILISVL